MLKFSLSLLRVAVRPKTRSAVVLSLVVDELRCNASDKRVFRVAVSEERTNGEQYFGDGESRRPVVFKNVQTNGSL